MVQYSILSKTGGREHNEDCVSSGKHENGYLFALADGLGGHGKGEIASGVAVNTSIQLYIDRRVKKFHMDQAFLQAQSDIVKRQEQDTTCKDMKTTLVLLQIEDGTATWGHIGDSRLYRFQNGKVVERTLDHSVPQMLVAIGEIKEKNIRKHPDRNRLLRVLGVDEDDVRYQISESVVCNKQQAFLLCSDGFWELIEEKKMEHTLKKAATTEEWLKLMEAVVIKNGRGTDMDNYSAIAVWVNQEGKYGSNTL
ncbi:MAG: PP2C family protein-serine/threonine phosphatase [Lachnospiraceae bacterium]